MRKSREAAYHKMSKISGFKNPLRSKLTEYDDDAEEIDLMSLENHHKRNNPYNLANIREENSFDQYNAEGYGPPDLETSSNRFQNRGFNQYLYQNDQITERSHEYLRTLNNSSIDQYE